MAKPLSNENSDGDVYEVTLYCDNCGWRDDYSIPMGVLAYATICSKCGCIGCLHKVS